MFKLYVCSLIMCLYLTQTLARFPTNGLSTECIPNETFETNCQFCWCTSEGTIGGCKMTGCTGIDKKVRNSPTVKEIENRKQGKECIPNQIFQTDCQFCWCTNEGTIGGCKVTGCTTTKKGHKPSFIETKNRQKYERGCIPNQIFETDCQFCWCTGEGIVGGCKMTGCKGMDRKVGNKHVIKESEDRQQRKECVPNAVFETDCQFCWCTSEGIIGGCKTTACTGINKQDRNKPIFNEIENQQLARDCIPNEVFETDCQFCWCTNEGTIGECKTTRCSVIEKQVRHKPVVKEIENRQQRNECIPNEVFETDCQSCWCTSEGIIGGCKTTGCLDIDEKVGIKFEDIKNPRLARSNHYSKFYKRFFGL